MPAAAGAAVDERRTAQRFDAPRITVRIPTIEVFRARFLRDLSEGGLFVPTSRTRPIDTELVVLLAPPGRASPLEIPARVARIELDPEAREPTPLGMGLRFESLDDETREALRQLICELADGDERPPGTETTGRPGTSASLAERLRAATEEIERLKAGRIESERASSRTTEALETALAIARSALDSERSRVETELDALRRRVRELEESLGHERESARLMMKAVDRDRTARESAERRLAELRREVEARRDRAGEPVSVDPALGGEALSVSSRRSADGPAGGVVSSEPSSPTSTRPMPRPTPPPVPTLPRIESQEEFYRLLRLGRRVVRTDRFRRFEPISPADSRMAHWLESADTLKSLVLASGARAGEEQVLRLLHSFYQRLLIDIVA